MEMKVIARVRSDFKEKFGIPRQSGLSESTLARIVFEPEYRVPESLRGLEGFSHLWLIWEFSEAVREDWSPTVRPPRLGGNARMGVFATRSPFRPNPIGLSAVKLIGIERVEGLGDTLVIAGADILDSTPVYDIKPYLPYADAHPDAVGGFAGDAPQRLKVLFPEELSVELPEELHAAVTDLLSLDPRPRYQHDPERVYGMSYGGYNVKFTVDGDTLYVRGIDKETK